MVRITSLCLLSCLAVQLRTIAEESDQQPSQPSVQRPLDADIEVVAERLREVIHKPWQIETGGREILIKYHEPVGFTNISYQINAPAFSSEEDREKRRAEELESLHHQECFFRLQFDDKLSLPEYRRISEARQKELDNLQASVRHMSHKFDDYLPSNEKDRRLLISYRRGVAALRKQVLPDLYTSEHSIHLIRSWPYWDQVADKQLRLQIDQLEQALMKLLKVYDPLVARRQRVPLGKYANYSEDEYRVATVLGKDIYRC